MPTSGSMRVGFKPVRVFWLSVHYYYNNPCTDYVNYEIQCSTGRWTGKFADARGTKAMKTNSTWSRWSSNNDFWGCRRIIWYCVVFHTVVRFDIGLAGTRQLVSRFEFISTWKRNTSRTRFRRLSWVFSFFFTPCGFFPLRFGERESVF